MVVCTPREEILAPVTLTPAGSGMAADDQAEIVRTVAEAMGWPTRPLSDLDGWTASGVVDGVEVQVLAAPRRGIDPEIRVSEVTTAEHAALLGDLVDWSATIPDQSKVLEVAEDLQHPGAGFRARLVLPDGADPAWVADAVMVATAERWGGYRGEGILPTGHALTISTGI
jgi:hypothetical protein